jgi:1-acyl-sn-glycerol-3-phosphate acyltransferase
VRGREHLAAGGFVLGANHLSGFVSLALAFVLKCSPPTRRRGAFAWRQRTVGSARGAATRPSGLR